MKSKHEKGFTLVELLVTIAILSILATVSIVGYVGFIERSLISNDQNLVTQLNNFKNAYMAAKLEDIDVRDVSIIIEECGIGELKAQSSEYGYGFYFNLVSQRFELLKHDEINNNIENYLKLPEDLVIPTDPSLPEIDKGESEDENVPNDEVLPEPDVPEDNEDESDDSNETEIPNVNKVIFTFNNEYREKDTQNSVSAEMTEGGSILVRNSIWWTGTDSKYIVTIMALDLSKIISATDDSGNHFEIDYSCETINTVTYINYDVEDYSLDKENKTITFNKIGTYKLIFEVGDQTESIIVAVHNTEYHENNVPILISIDSGKIMARPQDDSDTVDIYLPFFYYIKIIDFKIANNILECSDIESGDQSQIITDARIKVTIDNIEYPIILFDKSYCVELSNINPDIIYTFRLNIKYQCYNGEWYEITQDISFKVNSQGTG